MRQLRMTLVVKCTNHFNTLSSLWLFSLCIVNARKHSRVAKTLFTIFHLAYARLANGHPIVLPCSKMQLSTQVNQSDSILTHLDLSQVALCWRRKWRSKHNSNFVLSSIFRLVVNGPVGRTRLLHAASGVRTVGISASGFSRCIPRGTWDGRC